MLLELHLRADLLPRELEPLVFLISMGWVALARQLLLRQPAAPWEEIPCVVLIPSHCGHHRWTSCLAGVRKALEAVSDASLVLNQLQLSSMVQVELVEAVVQVEAAVSLMNGHHPCAAFLRAFPLRQKLGNQHSIK